MALGGRFIKVRCTGCGNEQVIFSHATTVVRCRVCEKTLAVPAGGKAKVKGIVLGEVEPFGKA
ncbi:MAG: 30S ribosomal protein S27e [Candidatus Hadarchaeales archaeon]